MKALAEIADIYPRMTSIHDSCLFTDSFAIDFINHGDKIIYCEMYLYIGYVNEATNFAESQGGGGSDTKDWGREKDEDEIEWIRRCLLLRLFPHGMAGGIIISTTVFRPVRNYTKPGRWIGSW